MDSQDDSRLHREPEPDLKPIMTHYKEFWERDVAPFFAKLYKTGGLDEKTTELIVTSLLALRGWETGVRTHAWQALEAGATPQEVRGAILISMSVGSINTAARGLAWAEPVIEQHQAVLRGTVPTSSQRLRSGELDAEGGR